MAKRPPIFSGIGSRCIQYVGVCRDVQARLGGARAGRILEGRRYGDGLHQALEAKENLKVQMENQTLASITYQNYFKLYKKLAGCTGTAVTESQEFYEIYNLNSLECV